jgi:predicted ribosomally synthesized peptide with nif11-like leader
MDKMEELYEKVAKDGTLQAEFNAIINDAQKAGEAATGEKLAIFAKEAGFDVTLEEMKDFFEQLAVKDNRELSDTELDMVAGGKDGDDIANSVLSIGIGC